MEDKIIMCMIENFEDFIELKEFYHEDYFKDPINKKIFIYCKNADEFSFEGIFSCYLEDPERMDIAKKCVDFSCEQAKINFEKKYH